MHCFTTHRPGHKSHTTQPEPQRPNTLAERQPKRPPEKLLAEARQQPGNSRAHPRHAPRHIPRHLPRLAGLAAQPGERLSPGTGLLDAAFLDRLAGIAALSGVDSPMAVELPRLKRAMEQLQQAEALRANHPPTLEAARSHLTTQVRRMQMVLQGHKRDLDTYQPNLNQVSHRAQHQESWLRLNRVLKNLAAHQALQAPSAPTPAKAPRELRLPQGLPPGPELDRLNRAFPEKCRVLAGLVQELVTAVDQPPEAQARLLNRYRTVLEDVRDTVAGYWVHARQALPPGDDRVRQLETLLTALLRELQDLKPLRSTVAPR